MTLVHAVPSQQPFHPLNAGALLLTILGICSGVGAAIGAAAGSPGIGLAIGALVGVPAGVAGVVVRYRDGG
jgi:hypothetical protein